MILLLSTNNGSRIEIRKNIAPRFENNLAFSRILSLAPSFVDENVTIFYQDDQRKSSTKWVMSKTFRKSFYFLCFTNHIKIFTFRSEVEDNTFEQSFQTLWRTKELYALFFQIKKEMSNLGEKWWRYTIFFLLSDF